MAEPQPVEKEQFIQSFPPIWPDETLRERIAAANRSANRCVVALDDDPTGTQTVHNIWVVTGWEVETLRAALADREPALYVLTNSRSLPLAQAQALNRTIAANLAEAAEMGSRRLMVVSRSDSTLRGHYPGEVDALREALQQAGMAPFDGVCLIPFFPEGGRFTAGDIHWVQDGQSLIPAAQTPYARDAVFGYQHSHLPSWVEEKTGGRLRASEVVSIPLETIRTGGPDAVASRLKNVKNGAVVIVNALADRDLEVFVMGLLQAENAGKNFLFRTAASFVKVAAGLSDRPLLKRQDLLEAGPQSSGLIVFGSHVPKSTAQLEALKSLERVSAVELPVSQLLDPSRRKSVIAHAAAEINSALLSGKEAVVYTSREVITGESDEATLQIGQQVSSALMEVVQRIQVRPGFMIGKGGITSSDLATIALKVRSARVMGQVYPGVPVWKLGETSRWPGLAYIVFPGNVGEAATIAEVVRMLRS